MIDQGSVPSLMGSTVRDSAGDKIGKVGQVYLDDTTGQPEWVTVRTGLFGTKESFVPLAAARVEGDELVVDVTKDRVTDAPADRRGRPPLRGAGGRALHATTGSARAPSGRTPARPTGTRPPTRRPATPPRRPPTPRTRSRRHRRPAGTVAADADRRGADGGAGRRRGRRRRRRRRARQRRARPRRRRPGCAAYRAEQAGRARRPRRGGAASPSRRRRRRDAPAGRAAEPSAAPDPDTR